MFFLRFGYFALLFLLIFFAFPPLIRCSLRSRLVGAVNRWSFPPKEEKRKKNLFGKQEGVRLYFATSPKKAVWQQLQDNPNIELLASADRISVRCKGAVSFEVEEDVKRWIFENNPVLPRLYERYDQLVYFVLPIAEMDYYDLNPTPPVFKHFDLISGEVSNGFVGERFSKVTI